MDRMRQSDWYSPSSLRPAWKTWPSFGWLMRVVFQQKFRSNFVLKYLRALLAICWDTAIATEWFPVMKCSRTFSRLISVRNSIFSHQLEYVAVWHIQASHWNRPMWVRIQWLVDVTRYFVLARNLLLCKHRASPENRTSWSLCGSPRSIHRTNGLFSFRLDTYIRSSIETSEWPIPVQ